MKNSIIEGNKVIAEFMGVPKCDRCAMECGSYKFGAGIYYTLEEMKYHSSWDWLIQVCKKFDTPSSLVILKKNSKKYIDLCDKLDHAVTTYDIELVFHTLVENINWYNSLTSKESKYGQ